MDYYIGKISNKIESLGYRYSPIQIDIAASYNQKQRRIAIIDYKVCTNGEQVFRVYKKNTAIKQKWHIEPASLESFNYKLFWEHFLPILLFPSEDNRKRKNQNDELKKIRAYTDLSLGISRVISQDLETLIHVGPLRDFPRRAYRMTGESPRNVGQRGENWLNILLGVKNRASIIKEVNNWLDKLGYKMRIEWGKQGYVHPMLTDKNGIEVSIKDTGFGISQLLPVLIQGYTCTPGTILILEQPEIHLHPKAQADLGDLLIAISKRGVRLLIETHSEHLLLRIQKRIAENFFTDNKTLSPNDVSLCFIEAGKEGSKVYNIQLGETGQYLSPPESMNSFFSDDYFESMEWGRYIAKIAKVKNEHHD
jgi:hypothetical protein